MDLGAINILNLSLEPLVRGNYYSILMHFSFSWLKWLWNSRSRCSSGQGGRCARDAAQWFDFIVPLYDYDCKRYFLLDMQATAMRRPTHPLDTWMKFMASDAQVQPASRVCESIDIELVSDGCTRTHSCLHSHLHPPICYCWLCKWRLITTNTALQPNRKRA